MPLYEYECAAHGPFEAMRPMNESRLPQDCPRCHRPCTRVILSAAALAVMPTATRRAHAANERSAHQPKTTKNSAHGKGCGCCGGKSRPKVDVMGRPVAKAFPTKRPWMISH